MINLNSFSKQTSPQIFLNNPFRSLSQSDARINKIGGISFANRLEKISEQKNSTSIIREEKTTESLSSEELVLVPVKHEPDLMNTEVISYAPLTIKEIKKGLPLINPHYNEKENREEIGIRNCLPCTISAFNWFINRTERPEEVDARAEPMYEHMTEYENSHGLLQDPFSEKLNIAIPVTEINDHGVIKQSVCLTDDLPLTFSPVKLSDLESAIKNEKTPWHQHGKKGEPFKAGILYLNWRSDPNRAHFLNYYYVKEDKKLPAKTKGKKLSEQKDVGHCRKKICFIYY